MMLLFSDVIDYCQFLFFMAKKSVIQRIRITRKGKVLRRAMALSHCRANKTSIQQMRKQRMRVLLVKAKTLANYL